ncbi:hypothetical protein GCM10009760_55780 [Kitasatospora kazusensis]|uniref:Uncharacterized protein n=1 Tax=Kitasatospora kazusensis TaxID=407974 RepID=A0ABN3A7S7_9ACTN
MGADAAEEFDGVVAGLFQAGGRMAGLADQADLPPVTQGPVLVHQALQKIGAVAGGLLQGGADRFQDQLQTGQFPHGGQHIGRVGPLPATRLDQAGLLQPGQHEIEEGVGPAVLGETLAEVGQHTVVEAGIVQLQAEGVLDVDAAAHRLGRLTVGQVH